MPLTPEQLALTALRNGIPRTSLTPAAQLEYDRLRTMTQPEREARHALDFGVPRDELSVAAQLDYDRLQETYSSEPRQEPYSPPPSRGRTSAEVREEILAMFKRANGKYAKPFEGTRLAHMSMMGGNWEEYGAIVLQMAMLDTLLSIEEKLDRLAGGNVQPATRPEGAARHLRQP